MVRAILILACLARCSGLGVHQRRLNGGVSQALDDGLAVKETSQEEYTHFRVTMDELLEEQKTLVEPLDVGAADLHKASGAVGTLHKSAPIFGTAFQIFSGQACHMVVTDDLDKDGLADIIPACWGAPAWYRNLGGGNFADATVLNPDETAAAKCLVTADIDNDGWPDVVTVNQRVSWYRNLGGGAFAAESVITTDVYQAQSVAAVDLDNDGYLDLVVASYDSRIMWYRNAGGGVFGTQSMITTAVGTPRSVFAADLDGDGYADVLSTSTIDNKIAWYRNTGAGSFEAQSVIYSESNLQPYHAIAIDLDDDGHVDVVTTSYSKAEVAWFRNLGGGSLSTKSIIGAAGGHERPSWVAAADMDHDGKVDVVAGCYNGPVWYQNLGGGSFAPGSLLFSAPGTRGIYPADLDNDGDIDFAAASYAAGQTVVSMNSAPTPPTPSPTQAITPAPTPAPASATGDPHLQNLHGERFDLMVPGAHVLIRIPRGERAENALLLVQADVRRLGAECSDMYFQSVNVTGSWAEAKQKGGYHYSVSQIAATSSEWVVFGKVAVKVVSAHTGKGVQYFNVYAKHLGLSGFVVGGLLGEDDHAEASTPPDACVNRVFLEKKGAGSAIQTLHSGSFAEASSA